MFVYVTLMKQRVLTQVYPHTYHIIGNKQHHLLSLTLDNTLFPQTRSFPSLDPFWTSDTNNLKRQNMLTCPLSGWCA